MLKKFYKKGIVLLLALGMGFVFSSVARADFISGNDLKLYCASQDSMDDAVCLLYITGAVDALATADRIGNEMSGNALQFCIPEGVSPDSLKSVVRDWLNRDDAPLDFGATLLILGAITDAYGCDN